MISRALEKILARVPTWPKAAQAELVRVAREIEEDFVIDRDLTLDLQEAHHEALREHGQSLDSIKDALGL